MVKAEEPEEFLFQPKTSGKIGHTKFARPRLFVCLGSDISLLRPLGPSVRHRWLCCRGLHMGSLGGNEQEHWANLPVLPSQSRSPEFEVSIDKVDMQSWGYLTGR